MKGKELAQLAIDNRKKAAELYEDVQLIRSETETEVRRLQYDVYQPKIRDLSDECDREMQKVRDYNKALEDAKEKEAVGLMEPVNQVERILEYFRLDTKQDLNIKDEEIKTRESYKERYRENLGIVFSDPYLKVRLFILENDKPKNKYMLVLIGKCLFDNGLGDRPLLKLPRFYGIDGAPWASSPQEILKESSNADELKTWWISHGFSKVPWLKDYLSVSTEYNHIKRTYKIEDFRDFLTHTCPKCGYFRTVFESYVMRAGEIALCPRDDIALVEVKHG